MRVSAAVCCRSESLRRVSVVGRSRSGRRRVHASKHLDKPKHIQLEHSSKHLGSFSARPPLRPSTPSTTNSAMSPCPLLLRTASASSSSSSATLLLRRQIARSVPRAVRQPDEWSYPSKTGDNRPRRPFVNPDISETIPNEVARRAGSVCASPFGSWSSLLGVLSFARGVVRPDSGPLSPGRDDHARERLLLTPGAPASCRILRWRTLLMLRRRVRSREICWTLTSAPGSRQYPAVPSALGQPRPL